MSMQARFLEINSHAGGKCIALVSEVYKLFCQQYIMA